MWLGSVRREGASSREAYLVVGRLRRLRVPEPRSGSGGTWHTEGGRASGPPRPLSAAWVGLAVPTYDDRLVQVAMSR
jgi:hypothetical protein